MLYRGLESSKYDVSSAALRRIDQSETRDVPHDEFVEAVKEMAEKARLRGHHIRDKAKRSQLELLADLQHFGAATCLIDFSKNPLIALWFACQNFDKFDKGKIVAVDSGDNDHFAQLNSKSIETKDIEELLYPTDIEKKPRDELWIWQPQHQNERIIAQQSAFIFGKGKIAETHIKECFVQNKSGILAELEKLGISEEYLFCDIHGYSRVHAHDRHYQARDYFDMARKAQASGKHDLAICYYDKAEEKIREEGENKDA